MPAWRYTGAPVSLGLRSTVEEGAPLNFVGNKVTIRAIEHGDLELLAKFHNDPEVGRMIEFSWPISAHAQEAFFERSTADQSTRRLIIECPAHGVVGYTGLWGIDWINRRATNGIIIGKQEARGKGYAQDAILTLLRVAFDDLGLHRVDADIFEFNEPSLRLYTRRCGFREEGRRRGHIFREGRYWDRILLGIQAEEYRQHVARLSYWKGSQP